MTTLLPPLTDAQVREIRELAAGGCCRTDIIEITGRAKGTVTKYAGDILSASMQSKRDARCAVLRRLIAAVERGDDRKEIAGRFGYKSTNVLSVAVWKARHKLGLKSATHRHRADNHGLRSESRA